MPPPPPLAASAPPSPTAGVISEEEAYLAARARLLPSVDAALDFVDCRWLEAWSPAAAYLATPRQPGWLPARLAAARRGAAAASFLASRATWPLDRALMGREIWAWDDVSPPSTGALVPLAMLVVEIMTVPAVFLAVGAHVVVHVADGLAGQRARDHLAAATACAEAVPRFAGSVVLRVGQLPGRALRGLAAAMGAAAGFCGVPGAAPPAPRRPPEPRAVVDVEALPPTRRPLALAAEGLRDALCCPISLTPLDAPVRGDDGYTYSQVTLLAMAASQPRLVSPFTRARLRPQGPDALAERALEPAYALADALDALALASPAAGRAESEARLQEARAAVRALDASLAGANATGPGTASAAPGIDRAAAAARHGDAEAAGGETAVARDETAAARGGRETGHVLATALRQAVCVAAACIEGEVARLHASATAGAPAGEAAPQTTASLLPDAARTAARQTPPAARAAQAGWALAARAGRLPWVPMLLTGAVGTAIYLGIQVGWAALAPHLPRPLGSEDAAAGQRAGHALALVGTLLGLGLGGTRAGQRVMRLPALPAR